jgi:hypothetical protein
MEQRQNPKSRVQACAHVSNWALKLTFLLVLLLMAAFYLAQRPAHAADDVVMEDGGDALDVNISSPGMPASNPRVQPILAAHPDQYVVVCVAGCDGKPKAVQILPRTVMGRQGAFVPAAGKTGRQLYGPPRPGRSDAAAKAGANDIVCVAGCMGRPGQVLQRVSDLPAATKVKSGKDQDNKRPKILR